MEKNDIIRKVNEPTEFVSNIVIVKKQDDKLRICLDPKTLNDCLLRQHHPMPTFDNIASRMKNSKYYSTLDCKTAFYQVKLSEESALLTTFITPFGRYCFKRMPYGIKTATEIYQKKFKEIFNGISNIEIYVDEIITWSDSSEDHYNTLKKILERAREFNIKFNKDKCRFAQNSIKFLGHVFDKDGIRMDEQKIRAIKDMQRPKDKKGVQRFLGTVTYLSRFIPNTSQITEPLRQLIKKQVEFKWEQEHEQAYNKLKECITSNPVLSYYDQNEHCVISVDASSTGIGAVLLQKSKPIAYSSKSFTESQKNWAQIEKELNAVVFGCIKFHQYVAGSNFTVETDHSPLIPIARKTLAEVPVRLQKMKMKLQPYDLNLVYKPGKELWISDMLSRAHLDDEEEDQEMNEMSILMFNLAENISDAKLEELKTESRCDPEISKLRELIKTGWPEDKQKIPAMIKPYNTFKESLYVDNDLVWKENCVVVPNKLRKEMLSKMHYNHMGVQKTKNRARQVVFWPGMSKEIEDMIGNCLTCLNFQRANVQEKLIPVEVPDGPWKTVGTDIFYFKNQNYLMVVDYFSKYIEMTQIPDMYSSTTINSLKSIFARHGIPYELHSDGGPQYNCKQFSDFAKQYNFKHIMSSPHYPRSNGMAERYIQTIKNILKKADFDNKDLYLSLLEYRNTPISNDIESPNELLYGRTVRGILPYFQNVNGFRNSMVHQKLKDKQMIQKQYHDRKARNLSEFKTGDRVRIYNKNRQWDPAIVYQKTNNPRQYKVLRNDNKILTRNRCHLRQDIGKENFNISPEIVEKLNTKITLNENKDVINSNIDNQVNDNSNHDINTNLNSSSNVNDNEVNPKIRQNENVCNQSNRPKRTIRKPNYLKDYW